MTRRIGKRTREAAIHCLEQCASDWIGGVASTYTWDVYSGGCAIEGAADDAWCEISRAAGYLNVADIYLEAAALLRDGWNPGDPVEVRP